MFGVKLKYSRLKVCKCMIILDFLILWKLLYKMIFLKYNGKKEGALNPYLAILETPNESKKRHSIIHISILIFNDTWHIPAWFRVGYL